ncbi:streptococcal hemagglutinin-like [Palaemon carinicauda]|uniref:streptococcal hemagglutinin-like n=1 Tax=Palaemon carinicauda TaxID=392227 RepID=UPI0035B6404B
MTFSSGFILAIVFIASGTLSDPSRRLNPTRPKAFDYAADAEIVVGELHHNFSCDGREYGYYADQGQQCQVFHICMPVKTATGRILDTFQFSFFCPSQTRFSQDSRTCISEAQAYPCHKAHTLYDLNKAIGHRPNKKKRPVNLKDAVHSNVKTNIQFTQSTSLPFSDGDTTATTFLKDSFDDASFALENIDELSVGLSVQDGVLPVHTDSTVTIGSPAVAVPPVGTLGRTTSFSGGFQSPSTAAPSVGNFVSNDLSEHLQAPEFVIPPGSQIISTKSLQHQDVLSGQSQTDGFVNTASSGNAKTSRINVSTHGSSGFSNTGSSPQAPSLTSPSVLSTIPSIGTTPFIHSVESTTPHSSFTTNEDFAFSRASSVNQDSQVNSQFNSITVNNRGNSLPSTESSVSLNVVATGGNTVRGSSQQDTSRFSNSHTLEAASLSSTGTSTSSASRGSTGTSTSSANRGSTGTSTFSASRGSTGTSTSSANRGSTGTSTFSASRGSTGTSTSSASRGSTGTSTFSASRGSTGTSTSAISGNIGTTTSSDGRGGTGTPTSSVSRESTGTATFLTSRGSTGTTTSSASRESTGTATFLTSGGSTGTTASLASGGSTGISTSSGSRGSTGASTFSTGRESTGTATSSANRGSTRTSTSSVSGGSTGTFTSSVSSGSTGTSTPSVSSGQISTFASRARAHAAQSISQHQASQSSGQGSQSFSFSHTHGNDRGTSSQPVITSHQAVTSTPQSFATTSSPVPSLSQQFTPPPITHALGTSIPRQIPGFSSGINRKNVGIQNEQEDFSNQGLSTLSSFPTTTEYFEEGGEFHTTVVTETPFESSKARVGGNNIQSPNLQTVGSVSNRGSARKVAVQRRPIQQASVDQVSNTVSNVQRTVSVNAGNINSLNSFSNNNRATTTFDQSSSHGSVTQSPFSHSVSSQRATTPSLSISTTHQNTISSVDNEQIVVNSQNELQETQNSLGGNSQAISVSNSAVRGSTTSRLSSRNRGNQLSSSRGLRTQITTTGSRSPDVVAQTSGTINVNRGSVNGISSQSTSVTGERADLDVERSSGVAAQTFGTGSVGRGTVNRIPAQSIDVTEGRASLNAERSSGVVAQTSGSVSVNRGSINRASSQSIDVTKENEALNTIPINRGSPRRTSQTIVENKTPRPVTSNRGSRKFQPSPYLLQSAGFQNPQWQPTQSQNVPHRNSVSRSHSRSRNGNASSNLQTSSVNQGDNGNDSPTTVVASNSISNIQLSSQNRNVNSNIQTSSINQGNNENDSSGTVVQDPSLSTSFDNARVSTTDISHGIVSDVEISKQTHNSVSHDISKEDVAITATTFKPVTQGFIQSRSRGRAFSPQGSSNNLLSSQPTRSRQSSYGTSSAITTESSLTSQYGSSQALSKSHSVTSHVTTPASRQRFTTSVATTPIPRRQTVTSNPNSSRHTVSSHSFSRSNSATSSVTSEEDIHNEGARKVIKKKIIVNGRPGSRKSHEPTVSVPNEDSQQETQNDEEEKKRQRALDALQRFSPGFANANLLAFRVIPNGAKKNIPQVTTTEATIQQTSKPQNSFNNQRRGGTRARFTTTAAPITTTQISQVRSRTSSRRFSRPVTQTSTTAKPIPTTLSPNNLGTSSRRIVNEQKSGISVNSASSQTSGSASISSSTTTNSRNRGSAKFTSSEINSRRRILKKVTPLSETPETPKNIDSSLSSFGSSSKISSSSQTTSASQEKHESQFSTHAGQPLEKPSGNLRVVGTSIASSVSSDLGSERSKSLASSSLSSSSSSSSRSRFNSRARSSSTSRNTSNIVSKQESIDEPLTDLELEALSALAQVNSAFSNAAKSQSKHISSSRGTSRRTSSSSRSRSRTL